MTRKTKTASMPSTPPTYSVRSGRNVALKRLGHEMDWIDIVDMMVRSRPKEGSRQVLTFQILQYSPNKIFFIFLAVNVKPAPIGYVIDVYFYTFLSFLLVSAAGL
jgi:hypothetical protein